MIKKFIAKLFLFVSILFILLIPFDYMISKILSQSNGYQGEIEVWNDIYNGNINSGIAIYGASRAFININPQLFENEFNESTYNFGIDGHNFWLQYLRHKELLRHNEQPKLIILIIDVLSLNKRTDLYIPDQFLPFMLWNKNMTKYTSTYEGFRIIDYYLPFIRYSGKRKALKTSFKILFKGSPKTKNRIKGFAPRHKEWNTDLDNAKKKMKIFRTKQDNASIELFEKFIIECKELGIDLMLVYPPEYIDGQLFTENRELIIKVFSDFASKYKLTYLDYSGDDMSYDKKYFYNSRHLNYLGADTFTKKLIQDINKQVYTYLNK